MKWFGQIDDNYIYLVKKIWFAFKNYYASLYVVILYYATIQYLHAWSGMYGLDSLPIDFSRFLHLALRF
jgi:hypothetical protein